MTSAREPGMRLGLRTVVVIAAVVLSGMAAVVSGALVVLTTSLHESTVVVRDVARSTRLAREAQVDLLLYQREMDPVERARAESELRETLGYSATQAKSHAARRSSEHASTQVERYLASVAAGSDASDMDTSIDAAMDALELAVQAGVGDADREARQVERLDGVANVIGALALLVLIGVPALLVVWIHHAALRPILSLSDAMDRFGQGDLAARAVPAGAVELRRMMAQFNGMGESLERQQQNRLTHLAGVAHDLRNPLAAIQMSSALLDSRPEPPTERGMRRTLAIVHRQVARLNRMVEDLLDASRVDAGQLALVLVDVDLRAIVQEAAELFRDASDVHEIHLDVPVEAVVVRGDPLRLEQTLTNLVSNAIKYSPRGGVVGVVARRDRDLVKVTVSDQGIGIDASEVERIWEPFRRSGVSTAAIPGVGLGLWVARRIVRAHGGTLTVESRPGHGSTFTLALPVVTGSRSNAHALQEGTPPPSRGALSSGPDS